LAIALVVDDTVVREGRVIEDGPPNGNQVSG
jgi:hypothetical protein